MSEVVDKLPQNMSIMTDELVVIPIFNPQCRVCKWSRDYIELYNFVSRFALNGKSAGFIRSKLKDYLEEQHPDIKLPTRKSLWNHFERHMRVPDLIDIKVAKQVKPDTEAKLLSEEAKVDLEEIKKGNFDEYKELCDLYIRFRDVRNKIYDLSNSLQLAHENNTNDVWSQNKIQTFVQMVNTQKAILSEIGKMRQGDKLIKLAAEHSLQLFAKSIVSKMTEEFQMLATIMRKNGVSEDLLETYEQITRQQFARVISNEAMSALDQTKKDYKLPN